MAYWPYFKNVVALGTGAVTGGCVATGYRCWEQQKKLEAGSYAERAGNYYQILGHAWDYDRQDFVMVFRPLYHTEAKANSHEAHYLATTTFKGRGPEYKPVTYAELSSAAKGLALPGPFWKDQEWALPVETSVVNSELGTTSGLGTRSHQERPTRKLLSS
mmetsp:Transcript_43819/g.93804  ORF Transcript_43819/g.93804 Transcript_43819/m.93804 type:complete len:160 (-) Transcript_43819:67-546(-)